MSKTAHALKASRATAPPVLAFSPYFTTYDINTVYGLAHALGGMSALAEDLGVSPDAVEKWAITGDIPNGWHLRLFAKACALGKGVNPCVWGFSESDEEALALSRLMKH